jgi:hypothetical protein
MSATIGSTRVRTSSIIWPMPSVGARSVVAGITA